VNYVGNLRYIGLINYVFHFLNFFTAEKIIGAIITILLLLPLGIKEGGIDAVVEGK
jgi:hypothetical protein